MDSLNDLISFLEIKKDDKVLDLGCGAGVHRSIDQTGR